MNVPFENLVSAEEAAKLLGIHPVTILKWRRENKIPGYKLGRKVTFRVSEIENWLKQQKQ